MLCVDNPYPPLCKKRLNTLKKPRGWWEPITYPENYSPQQFTWNKKKHIIGLSCLDFYNQSDNRPLWWQQLRHETVFYPKNLRLYMDDDNECTSDILFHFYVNEISKMPGYVVQWQRGKRLRQQDPRHPNTINVCYSTNKTMSLFRKLRQERITNWFSHCLLSYGRLLDLVLNRPLVTHHNHGAGAIGTGK